jgi:hypothetical protein
MKKIYRHKAEWANLINNNFDDIEYLELSEYSNVSRKQKTNKKDIQTIMLYFDSKDDIW